MITRKPSQPTGRKASTQAGVSSISRSSATHGPVPRENFPYDFKGAQSAPDLAGHHSGQAPRKDDADPDPAQLPSITGAGLPGETLRAWAPFAALRPSGPRRRRRASRPRGPTHRPGAATISARRANCKSTILPALQCEAGQRSPTRALRVTRDGLRPPLRLIFPGFGLAPIRRMARTEHLRVS